MKKLIVCILLLIPYLLFANGNIDEAYLKALQNGNYESDDIVLLMISNEEDLKLLEKYLDLAAIRNKSSINVLSPETMELIMKGENEKPVPVIGPLPPSLPPGPIPLPIMPIPPDFKLSRNGKLDSAIIRNRLLKQDFLRSEISVDNNISIDDNNLNKEIFIIPVIIDKNN
jgi:hypothetical protein